MDVATTAPNSANDDDVSIVDGEDVVIASGSQLPPRMLPQAVAQLEQNARSLMKKSAADADSFGTAVTEIEQGIQSLEGKLVEQKDLRKCALPRFKKILDEAVLTVEASLSEERTERLAREQVTQQMVQAVSDWLRAQE